MSDAADQADAIQARFNALAETVRRGQQRALRPARAVCIDCGDPIPEARRQAVPGATRCALCQADEEQRLQRLQCIPAPASYRSA